MKIQDFRKYKDLGRKISFITCYDYSSARIIDNTNIDCVLVGDSLAMTMYGEQDTLCANIGMIASHTRAVAKGIKNKFIVSDLPFISYRGSLDSLNSSVLKLMQTGANAVKLEGVEGNEDYIKHLVNSGVPVMGHIGLTPQFINTLGGYVVQGKTQKSAKLLLEQAKRLERAGCFSIVLECVPTNVADQITKGLTIPTIGIGAGNKTDGQVLVIQDMLGLNIDFTPKFAKKYMQGSSRLQYAINKYCEEVKSQSFPCDKYSFEATTNNELNNNNKIKVFETIKDLREYLSSIDKNLSIGFVPTMGNLHDGHASLLKESVNSNDVSVLSIFVNPTQFNDKNDLENYPRTIENDLELASKIGVDCVFLPCAEEMYHENLEFRMVCNSEFAEKCEGGRRGHFDGMLTVVVKLLNIVKADNVYFGEKDYQQYKLVEEMVAAFFLDTKIIPCRTVRLASGLAMSSRNNNLSEKGIKLAGEISSIIQAEKCAKKAKEKISKLNDVEIIYIEDLGDRRLYAFMIEGVRLIDNYNLSK